MLTDLDMFAMHANISWDTTMEQMRLKGNKDPSIMEVFQYRAQMCYAQAQELLAEKARLTQFNKITITNLPQCEESD